MGTDMQTQGCVICGHAVSRLWLKVCPDYYLGMPYRVDYAECEHCAMVQQVAMPKDTSHFYEAYPVHKSKGKAAAALFRSLLITNVYFSPDEQSKDAALLDLGCGDGSYLESIQGKFAKTFGFEPGEMQAKAVADRLKCDVFTTVDAAKNALRAKVDEVTAHFVLEHVTDPHATFDFVSSLLRPGGVFYLALPNIKSREARLFGRKWHGLDAPSHLCFLEREGLEQLADRHGFRLEKSGYGIFPNAIAARIVNAVTGRHLNLPFLTLLPLAFLIAAMFPSGTTTFSLCRI